jgi:2'-5' RNA ligase
MRMNNFKYADTASWEDWMKEYRYGAMYIIPPAEIMEQVNQLRQHYDPKSHSISPAHISLSEAFQSPMTEEQFEELQATLDEIKPFEIEYGPLKSFPPHPGVVYAISPEDKFMQLRSKVHSTSMFEGVPLNHAHIPPHMTVAEFITLERTEELLRELQGEVPEGKFLCDAIEYYVPNKDFYFEKVLTMSLGKN